jgi:hypothetical protein
MIPRIIELGKEGKTINSFAAEFDVSLQLLLQWQKNYPELNEAILRAETYARKWWEELGQLMMFDNQFNTAMYALQMKGRFNWDKRQTNINVDNSVHDNRTAVMNQSDNFDLKKLSANQLRSIRDILSEAKVSPIEQEQKLPLPVIETIETLDIISKEVEEKNDKE